MLEADRIEIREMIQEEIEMTKYNIMELMQTVNEIVNRIKKHAGILQPFNEEDDYTEEDKLRYLPVEEESEKNNDYIKEYDIVVKKLTDEEKHLMGTTDSFYTYGDDDITVKYIKSKKEEEENEEHIIEVYSNLADITVYIDIDTGYWTIDEVS